MLTTWLLRGLTTTWGEVKNTFRKKYKMKDLGLLNWVLGMEVIQDIPARTIRLNQSTYVKQLLDKFDMTKCHESQKEQSPQEGYSRKTKIPNSQLVYLFCEQKFVRLFGLRFLTFRPNLFLNRVRIDQVGILGKIGKKTKVKILSNRYGGAFLVWI